jgi:hypothetical protein
VIQKTANIFVGDPNFSSKNIAEMFRLYETEDGLLIPGSMLDSRENQGDKHQAQPASRMHPAAGSTAEPSKPRAKKPGDNRKKKKEVDDRQLKLFDDE